MTLHLGICRLGNLRMAVTAAIFRDTEGCVAIYLFDIYIYALLPTELEHIKKPDKLLNQPNSPQGYFLQQPAPTTQQSLEAAEIWVRMAV